MIRKFTRIITGLLFLPLVNQAQSTQVEPPNYAAASGNGTFAGPLSNTQRSYQMLMDSTIITNLLNQNITSIAFRSSDATSTTWPASITTFNNYDIYMGKAILLQNGTNTFTDNQTGTQTQVRSGALVINPNEYPVGGFDSWGPPITFNNPYNYTGANLSILIRHNGSNGTSRSNNALVTSTSGYNTLFKACWQGNYTGTGGSQGNFTVIRLTYSGELPVELVSFKCTASGYNARIKWESASEKNTDYYLVERSFDGIQFESIYKKPVNAESNGLKKYQTEDLGVFKINTTVFYRLKMVDKNGIFKYSNINKISSGMAHTGNLIVYPNPVKSIANISYEVPADATVSCKVYDITGRIVYNDIFKSLKGNNAILVDFGSLNKGHYILKLSGCGMEDSYKFIKE